MPVALSSFLLPRNGNTWFLVEDKYVKGGLQVLPSIVERDAMNPANMKIGQLVIAQDTGIVWQLKYYDFEFFSEVEGEVAPPAEWVEFIAKSNYNPFHTHKQPIPQAEWVVMHNKGCKYFSFNVYDSGGRALIPNEVDIVDDNNVVISFIVPMMGHCSFAFDQLAVEAPGP